MMKTINISIAKDFSDVPLGRYLDDGDYSGQKFRDKYLQPALSEKNHLIIDLDDTEGYGSSFLEEAFGGLVRCGFEAEFILNHIIFVSNDDPSLVEEIEGYIKAARREAHH